MKPLSPGIVVISLLGLLGQWGCSLKDGGLAASPATGGTVTGLPSSPAEVDEVVCVGVSPDPSAWLADPYPIRFPAVDLDAQQGQGARPDVLEETTEQVDDVVEVEEAAPPNPSATQSPGEEPVDDPDVDPCVAEPGTCLGAPAPEWALLDFQPQSCGSGATYGLQAFHGHVTVMALFASW